MTFIKDGTSVGNALVMGPSGRKLGPMAVVVDKYSKSSSCDDDGCIERFGNDEK